MFEIAGGIVLAVLFIYIVLPVAVVAVVGMLSLTATILKKVSNVQKN